MLAVNDTVKIVQEISLISKGSFEDSQEWAVIRDEIRSALVLPNRKLYPYLTDRIGNYEELEPYFDVWRAVEMQEGFLAIFVIEHDALDGSVPRITKGTDGRALL